MPESADRFAASPKSDQVSGRELSLHWACQANGQEAEAPVRFRLSRHRSVPVQRSSLVHPRHPEIRAEARRRVCLRRWPRPSHQAQLESNRELRGVMHHPGFRVRPFLPWVERVQRLRAPFPYHSKKYKSRPQKVLLAYHSQSHLEAIALEARERPGIFVATAKVARVQT